MTQFKAGDKVRRIGCDKVIGAKVGQIATVVGPDRDIVWVKYDGMDPHSANKPYEGWYRGHVELVKPDAVDPHDHAIAVIQAHKEGKVVQYRDDCFTPPKWRDIGDMEELGRHFFYSPALTRIKPEPRVLYIVELANGLVYGSTPNRKQAEAWVAGGNENTLVTNYRNMRIVEYVEKL